MKRVVVIGIGNRLMKDDGIAIAVTEDLKNRIDKGNMEVIIGETDFCFYMSKIKDQDYVIIIDAFYSGSIPGSITLLPIGEVIGNNNKPYFQHDMGFSELTKYYPKIEGYLIGIEVAEVGFGLDLSPILKEQLSDICAQVEKQIIDILKDM